MAGTQGYLAGNKIFLAGIFFVIVLEREITCFMNYFKSLKCFDKSANSFVYMFF